MTRRGLMLGRFQPFHNGHLALTKQILTECDELVIIIGSAQFNFIDKDPFSAGERLLMIHEGLKEAEIDLCFFQSLIYHQQPLAGTERILVDKVELRATDYYHELVALC